MEKKIIRSDVYMIEYIYLIGEKEELKKWILKNYVGSKKYVFKKGVNEAKMMLLDRLEEKSRCGGFCASDCTNIDGYKTILIVVIADSIDVNINNNKRIEKQLVMVNFHELRHAVDVLINSRRLKWEDFEASALLQGWLNSETYEPFQKFLERYLKKENV